jgi:glucokinase
MMNPQTGLLQIPLAAKTALSMCKSAFMSKGRFSSLLSKIRVHIIVKPDIALFGAACHGFEQLETR